MLRRSSLVAGVMMVLMVSMASAQQRGGRGGRGGFGGPGMRGPGFGPGGMSSAMLLRIPEVREELSTSEEQNTKIDEVLDEMQESMQAARPNFQGFQDLSEEERGKLMLDMRKKSEATTKKADAAIAKTLDKKQLGRLSQLQLQREGVNAFHRPDVAKQLDLTEEQEAKLGEIQAKAAEEGRAAFGRGQDLSEEERQEMFTKMRERQKKTEADLLAVLTEEQQTKWTEMQGGKFDFPQQGFGGFGGGGPGAGGRGGAGGAGGARGERRRPPVKDSQE
jgi:hypothetical protein